MSKAEITKAQLTVLSRLERNGRMGPLSLHKGLIVANRTCNVLIAKGFISCDRNGIYEITNGGRDALARYRGTESRDKNIGTLA